MTSNLEIPTDVQDPRKPIAEWTGGIMGNKQLNGLVKLSPGIKVLEDGLEHDGKFYFIRALSTALGVLAGWTVWLLALAAVGIVIILLFGGPGAVIPEEDGIRDPQPGSDYSLACDPATEQC